jgi:hypothetical protein
MEATIQFYRIAKTAINCKDSNLLFSNRKSGSKGIRKEESAERDCRLQKINLLIKSAGYRGIKDF